MCSEIFYLWGMNNTTMVTNLILNYTENNLMAFQVSPGVLVEV